MPSHPGFIDYNTSRYIDGQGLSYNYSGPTEGGEFWYISNNKDLIKDGYVFYARMDSMPSMGTYGGDGYYFTHIGMGNYSSIMTGIATHPNGSLYIAKYFPSYIFFIIDGLQQYYPYFEFVCYGYNGNLISDDLSLFNGVRLYKLEYDAASTKALYYVDGTHQYSINNLDASNTSPVSMFFGAQNARNWIDYIIGYKYYPEISKSQSFSNGNIELTIQNTGAQTITNANVDFNISGLGFQNQSLSSQTLSFNKPANIEVTTIPYDSPYMVANTTFSYNSLGQQIQMNDPDLGVWSFEYDLNGNIVKQTDNKSVITIFEYDALNRITKIDYPTDADIIYEYDNGTIGTLSKVTSEIMTKSYTYDQRLRVIEENVTTEADMYIRSGYNIKYESSGETELPIPNPIIRSVYGVDEITDSFYEDGFYVNELKFTDLRVAMFIDDIAYLYLNNNLILEFVDHGGGGDIFIYDSTGALVDVISPVNGNPGYEDITFNMTFTISDSDVFLDIERNFYWWGSQQFNYSFDIGAPITDMYFYLDSYWDDYTYIDCTYEVTYERDSNGTVQPDPQIPNPVIYSFTNQEEVLAQFNESGFYVNELNLTDFRVSMYVNSKGYVYLNNYEILRFVDDAGGGKLYVYDLSGNQIGLISPVNGNPGYENILFNISFVSDLSNIYLQIDRTYYGSHSYYVYSFPMNESISDLRLYHDGYLSNSKYLNGTYKATYAIIPGSQPPGPGLPDPNLDIEEINDYFRVSDNQIIQLSQSGYSPTELNLKNLKAILEPDTTSSVYINNKEMLRFENSSQNGTLYVLDGQNNILGTIHDANGDLEAQNATFDVSFNFTTGTSILVQQYQDGVLVDTYPYSCASLGSISTMKITYDSNSSSFVDYTTTYQYDSMNRVTNITYPNGQTSSFTYDDRGMLKSIPGIIDDIEYNSLRLITKKVYPNGVTTNFAYDAVSKQLSSLWSINQQSQYLQHFEYEFDNVGNVAKITDLHDGNIQNFVYDDLNRLVMAGGDDYYQYYAYNPLGAMLAVYDGMSSIRFEHGVNAGIHAPTKVDDIDLIYDSNGNLIEDGNFIYFYDEANFLRAVQDKESNDIIAEYWYDENGQRVKKLEYGRASYYINSVYSVEDGKNAVYYFANGDRIAKETIDGVEWYLHDYLGSTNVVVDESGMLSEKISYYPFGSYRSVNSETSQRGGQQVTMTNLFDKESFTVEKEYSSMSVSQYIQRFGAPSTESKQMEEKLREYGYEPQNLIANMYESYNIRNSQDMQSMEVSISSFNNSSLTLEMDPNGSKLNEFESYNIQIDECYECQECDCQECDCQECDCQECDCQECDCQECDCQECDCQECDCQECDCQECDCQECDCQECDCQENNHSLVSKTSPNDSKSAQFNELELNNSSLEARIAQAQKTLNNSSSSRISSVDVQMSSAAPPKILVPSGFATKEFGTNQTTAVYQKQDLVNGHKYYLHSNLVGNGANAYTEQFTKTHDNLTRSSVHIHELDSVAGVFTYRTGDRQGIENILASNMDSDIFMVTEPVLVDLTATFGAGNEPDAEWCYENIPYFMGTQTMTVQRTTSSDSIASSKYTYTGKEFDSDIGLYYYGARYYNPSTFTFTQADSVIPNVYNPQALNRYSYSYNNPVTYTDPDGHMPLLVTAAIGAVAGGIAAGAVSAWVQYSTTGEVNKTQVLGAAAGGAIAGGIIGLTLGAGAGLMATAGVTTLQATAFTIPIGMIGSFGGGLAGRTVESLIVHKEVDLKYVFDPEHMLEDLVFGAIGGATTKPVATMTMKAFFSNGARPALKIILKETATETSKNLPQELYLQSRHINYNSTGISNGFGGGYGGAGGSGSSGKYCPICGAPL